ncbi:MULTISPECIES: hypothetical protein [Actinotignum]|uniref:Uncharacterized protein n=2 Tax=Actinotignum timonense TaxID=1870995 RepID=A0AAW9HM17_9ACTO|nr:MULTISPECIES: hypothetical protein [Actinotignum]MDE1558742.1 hypothetical protein [Actinotignum schaalii]MDE1663658.1 hypothetical protein [Actinotignum schaalii]MDK6373891.1 hypothetical protein [Actinotignum timonense]MDK6419572.1 hypothetical protein [Actinotignum timonense]MDK6590369.1 hypothetical protein [Actinotignum timonense]
MKIYPFWARESAPVSTTSGPATVAQWGWSANSEEEAHKVAWARLHRLVDRIAELGHFPRERQARAEYYPGTPLREEILAVLSETNGTPTCAITRNRYGAEVLNTADILIADVDVPELEEAARARGRNRAGGRSAGSSKPGFFARLFGFGAKKQKRPTGSAFDPAPEPASTTALPAAPDPASIPGLITETAPVRQYMIEAELIAFDRIEHFARLNAAWPIFVYRTFKGFRVIVAVEGIAADSGEAQMILNQLGSDPLYMRLCRVYESYRARLTAKPWRVGMAAPAVRWPEYDASSALCDPVAREKMQRWLEQYDDARAGHATTRFLAAFGPAPTGRAAQVVELHARVTGAESGLPLA